MELTPVAYIRTDFPEKFGIPRQAGLVPDALGRVVFTGQFQNGEAVRGLESFSHLWLIWDFSANHGKAAAHTVRPPRLGGSRRLGVFATRSPFRPNPLGLSCVRLLEIRREKEEGLCLIVGGVDLMDRTPILDIKPYLPYADAHPEALGGFTEGLEKTVLRVHIPEALREELDEKTLQAISDILRQDPRTPFIHDEDRCWGISYKGLNVRFFVREKCCEVVEIGKAPERAE